jgi:hypothetical protein
MKKSWIILVLSLILVLSITELQAQPLPPNGGHGQTGDQLPGGGAPLNPALGLIISAAGFYLLKKYHFLRNLLQKEE